MLDPHRFEDDARWDEPTRAKIREIHRTFTRSGLYRNDGSAEPVWTVDWYADQHGIEVASDGIHVIRVTRWVKSPDAEAVVFFDGCTILCAYSYRALLGDQHDHSSRTVSGYLTAHPAGRPDDRRNEFELGNVDGKRVVFDIRTGAMVAGARPSRSIHRGWWVGLVAIALVVALAADHWRLRRRAAQSAESRAVPERCA